MLNKLKEKYLKLITSEKLSFTKHFIERCYEKLPDRSLLQVINDVTKHCERVTLSEGELQIMGAFARYPIRSNGAIITVLPYRRTHGAILNEDKRKIDQYSFYGEYIRSFRNAMIAGKTYGTSPSKITEVCEGKAQKAQGFIWKYGTQTIKELYGIN